jgi:hypothetical protein
VVRLLDVFVDGLCLQPDRRHIQGMGRAKSRAARSPK